MVRDKTIIQVYNTPHFILFSLIFSLLGSPLNAIDMESIRLQNDKESIYPLSETIKRIEQRMNMFDEHYIAEMQMRLSTLKRDLDILEKDKTRSADLLKAATSIADFKAKVESVYAVAECIPDIVQRFKSLESIHQASGRAAQRLQGSLNTK